jgi:hypothetical protein
MTPILELKNVSAGYDHEVILHQVNLKIYEHDFLGIGMNIDREKINATHKADESCFGDFVPRFGKELP